MIKFDSSIWDDLENLNTVGEEINAKLAFPNHNDGIYCAIDSERNRHLLIKISDEDLDLSDEKSRGLKVNTVQLEGLNEKSNRFYDFKCIEKEGQSALDFMVEEIVDIRNHNDNMFQIVSQLLSKWRFFWSQGNTSLLGKEQQIGLFAELWFFLKWLFPLYGPNSILNWKGPWNNKNDFEFRNCSIEVKGTTNPRGRIHTINGLDQLSAPDNFALYLFSLQISEENGARFSLKSLVDDCIQVLSCNIEAVNHFETGVSLVGYSPIFENEYDKVKYRVESGQIYSVKEDFPRITKEYISANELMGIEKVNYEINLNPYTHLVSADSENQMVDLGIVL